MKFLNAVHKYDVRVFFWFNNVRLLKNLVTIFKYLSKTGDGQLYVLIMLLCYRDENLRISVLPTLLLAFALERPLYFMLKNSFKRNRPQAALVNFNSFIVPSDQFSFPSGHTSAAFMVATILGHFFPVFLFSLFSWACLVGISRVVLGVHFPTDIVIGAVMGIGIASFCIGLV